MKWTKDEENLILKLLISGKSYKEISLIINRNESSIRGKFFKLGKKSSTYYKAKKIKTKCKECDKELFELISRNKIFCSQSCNATFNNKLRIKNVKNRNCLFCFINVKKGQKYCSYDCSFKYRRKKIYDEIENGNVNLNERNYKKYLIYKYGDKCMDCGWCEINKKTGNVPIQLEHIDGHSTNNNLKNLKLLCPNCHSLTPTYGYLNKGNGRKNRYKK